MMGLVSTRASRRPDSAYFLVACFHALRLFGMLSCLKPAFSDVFLSSPLSSVSKSSALSDTRVPHHVERYTGPRILRRAWC